MININPTLERQKTILPEDDKIKTPGYVIRGCIIRVLPTRQAQTITAPYACVRVDLTDYLSTPLLPWTLRLKLAVSDLSQPL